MLEHCWKIIVFCFSNIIFSNIVAVSSSSLDNAFYMDFTDEPEDTRVAASKPFVLNCSIRNFSNLTYKEIATLSSNITWLKDGEVIEFNDPFSRRKLLQNGSLYISSAIYNSSDSDAGIYQCRASSKLGALLSTSAHVQIAELPARLHQIMSITTCVSSIVHLNCTFDGADPIPVVNWYKDDYLIGSNADDGVVTTAKHPFNLIPSIKEVEGYILLHNGALEISRASLLDAGSYHCTGSNAAGTVQGSQYNMSISSEFSQHCSSSLPHFISRPQPSTAVVGETTYLTCSIEGRGNRPIKWLKETEEIVFRNRGRLRLIGRTNLMIENTQLDDDAEYSCVLEKPTLLVASAKLTVLEPPRLVNQPNHLYLAQYGCQISLPCNVTGKPKPLVTWYKDGVPVEESNALKLKNNVLVKTITNKQDAGVYQCFAQNDVGQIQIAHQLLFVAQDDEVETNQSISSNDTIYLDALTNSFVRLTWSAFGLIDPTSYTISVYDSTEDRYEVFESANSSFRITKLKSNHTVHVIVTPRTSVCAGLPSKEIIFTVPLQDMGGVETVQNFAVEPMETSVLVKWSPPANHNEEDHVIYEVVKEKLTHDVFEVEQTLNTAYTSHRFSGLQKYTSYRFQVAVLNPSGEPGSSTPPIVTTTLESEPESAPVDITVTVESSETARVQWSAPPQNTVNGPIVGYNIKYKDLDNDRTHTVNTRPDATQYILTGLRRNTRYWLKMQVNNNVDSGPLSRKYSFTTPRRERMEKSRPGPPELLEPKISAREIILMWLPPEDKIYVREYVIGWGESGPYEQTHNVPSEDQFYRITGLEPYTQYFLSVRARNRAGMGEEYHTELWTTAVDDTPDELYPPLGVHVTVLTHTTLNVTWHDADQHQKSRYYVVRYKTNIPELPRVGYVNSSDVTCIIHSLRPHTVYEIAVKVVQDGRKSTWSMTETATTDESKPGSAPTDLTVMPIEEKPTFVQLNWQPPVEPNGELNGYLIFYTTDQTRDIDNWVIEPVVGDKLSTTIEGLTEDTQYYFKALARNKQGVSPYSDVVAYRTPKLKEPSEAGKSTAKAMPYWMWYIIIGAVALLVISIIIVSTIMICRSRKNKSKKSHDRRGNNTPLFHSSGIRSTSGESFPYSVNSNPSGKSVSIRPAEQYELHSYSPYCAKASSSELAPLNESSSYLTKYPYASHHHGDMMRSPMTSDSCQCFSSSGQYMNGNPVKTATLHHSACDVNKYDVEYRYPYTNLPLTEPDLAGDSAYGSGSDHQHHQVVEEHPTVRPSKLNSTRRQKLKDDLHSSDRSLPSSSFVPSTSSDDRASNGSEHLANVNDFLREMSSDNNLTSPVP